MATAPQISQTDWLMDYTSPRSLPLDQEALRIYEHAYEVGRITESRDDPKVSFTTLLIALLHGADETSRWFAGLAADNGPKPVQVYGEKTINKQSVESIVRPNGRPNPIELSSDRELLTVSAHKVLENAEQWSHRVGGSDIGVRHLVASYVLNPPPNHRAQMQRWNFKEAKWRSEFFSWVAERYTAEQWTDASHRPAPTKAVPTFEQQKIKGASLAFPGDANTDAVLEKASEFHSGRNDRGLQLQTVFYALIETARHNNSVRDAIQPIWTAVEAVKTTYETERDVFLNTNSAGPNTSFSGLDISPSVLNALETARELAIATGHDTNEEFEVGVLHLAGALISRRVDGDQDLATLGLEPQTLRNDLINHAAQQAESVEVWRESLGEEETLEAGRPLDLNSDEPEAVVRLDEDWKYDPLSIRPDVEAFAALLASKNLEPPLSIGLFGPWGSGKTTFLRRLQRAVKRRADDAKDKTEKGEHTPYVSNVVHVDFNAWHFTEEALTSSLVETIFRALRSYIQDDTLLVGKALQTAKQESLESTRRKLAAAKAMEQAAKTAVTSAETALLTARNNAADRTTKLRAAVQAVWTATKNSFEKTGVVKQSGVLEAIGDTVKSSEELESKLNSIRTRPARMLHDLGWGRSLLFALLVLATPPLVGWLVGKIAGQTGQVLSTMTTVMVVIVEWLRNAARAASKVDQAIAHVASQYEEEVSTNQEVKSAEQEVIKAQAGAAAAATSVQAAHEALAKAEAEVAKAELPAQMLQLVSNRIEDQTYNKELTTLSLARADLYALSTILRDQQTSSTEEKDAASKGETNARSVDRVILYIDDLDRSEPKDVVRVLQLVHMLLAFELFVVVVAVDARWVEEALVNNYKWLDTNAPAAESTNGGAPQLKSVGRVTPQDYLEKIFQISFWLEPMTSARAASYLGSLVRKPAAESAAIEGAIAPAVPVETRIEITGIELDYMRALAAHVGPSPRRVKRLVNAYRLIKARLSDSQLQTFLEKKGTADEDAVRPGPYQLVIGLLVMGTGAPSTSMQILKELSECDPTDTLDSVVDRFRERNQPDWTMAARVTETLMRTQGTRDVSELRGWARKVGRFLLKSPSADVATIRPHTPSATEETEVQSVKLT